MGRACAQVKSRGHWYTEAVEVTREQRRTLIALACRVAWADGVVEYEERSFIADLVRRLGDDTLEADELESWLDKGPPRAELESLPPELGQFFFYEALRLAESDGDMDPREQSMVEDILGRVFQRIEQDVGEGASLGRVRLRRKES